MCKAWKNLKGTGRGLLIAAMAVLVLPMAFQSWYLLVHLEAGRTLRLQDFGAFGEHFSAWVALAQLFITVYLAFTVERFATRRSRLEARIRTIDEAIQTFSEWKEPIARAVPREQSMLKLRETAADLINWTALYENELGTESGKLRTQLGVDVTALIHAMGTDDDATKLAARSGALLPLYEKCIMSLNPMSRALRADRYALLRD